MSSGLKLTLLLAIPLALYLLDRLMLWMERRGWVYWRNRPVGSASPGRALFAELQQLVEPQIRHVEHDKRERRATIDDESDDER